MIYFPQLFSGATAQFPITRQRSARTVVNQSYQGYQVKLADPGAAVMEWHLSFEEMSDEELAALEALFQAAQGRLTPFTFLDPADNLLAWSEAQGQTVWQAAPLLELQSGLADPMGGTAAFSVTNPSAAILTLQQSINAPASLEYCISLYACSSQSTNLWLIRGSHTDAVSISPQWARVSSSGQLADTADSISFGIALDPGSSISVFGFQAEAQPAASLYKQTAESGGVYSNARFATDALQITAVGPSRYSCQVDILNVECL